MMWLCMVQWGVPGKQATQKEFESRTMRSLYVGGFGRGKGRSPMPPKSPFLSTASEAMETWQHTSHRAHSSGVCWPWTCTSWGFILQISTGRKQDSLSRGWFLALLKKSKSLRSGAPCVSLANLYPRRGTDTTLSQSSQLHVKRNIHKVIRK